MVLLRSGAMTPDVWFCLVFAVSIVGTYVLWCLETLPRFRVVLVFVGVICLGIAMQLHGDLFAAAPTKPALPLAATQGTP